MQTPCRNFQFLKMSRKCFKVFGSTTITLQRQFVSLKNKLKEWKCEHTRYTFVAVRHLLLDVVDALSKVSLSFQEDGITISRVQDRLTTLSATLESFKERPGKHLNSFLTEARDGIKFKGIELERDPADRQAISAIQTSAVNAAMTFIQERFEGMTTDDPVNVLSAAAVLTNHRPVAVADRPVGQFAVGQLQTGICCSYMEKLKSRHYMVIFRYL